MATTKVYKKEDRALKNRVSPGNNKQESKDLVRAHAKAVKGKFFFSYGFSGRLTPRLARLVSTRAFSLGRRILSLAAATSARAYATALLIYGILTVILNLGADFFNTTSSMFSIFFGAVVSLFSVFLFFSDKPIGMAVSDSRILDFIVYEFFCVKRPNKESTSRGFNTLLLAFFAVFLSLIGFVLPYYLIPTVAIGLFLAYFSFISPEFPLFLSLSTLPFLPYIPRYDVILATLSFIMALSFLRKVAFGKRTYNFELYELLVFGIIAAFLVSGIFYGGMSSFVRALTFIPIALAYSVTSNVILNRRLCDCLLGSVIFSSVPTSVIASVQFALLATRVGFLEALSVGVRAAFDNSITLSAYLTVSMIFTVFYLFEKELKRTRALLIPLFLLQASALLFAGSPISLIAIGSALLLALFAKGFTRALPFGAILAFLLPPALIAALSLPPLSRFSALILGEELSTFAERIGAALDSVMQNPVFGIGVGVGDGNVPMLVGLAVSVGTLAALFLFAIIVMRIFHVSAFSRYLRESHFGSFAVISLAAIVALSAFGSVYFILSDDTLAYLFFSVFALGGAACRGAKESDDELRLYYHYSKREYSATIDVVLDRR